MLGRAERAVDADDQRPRVLDRDPERLDRLTGEVAPAAVDGGEREPERQLRHGVLRGRDRRLAVERVEDGLDQEQVDAAVAQRTHLPGVRLDDLVEGRGAERGLVDARRERERDVERPDRAGDEARPLGRPRRPLVGGAPGEAGACEVHVVDGLLERVVGLPDRRRRERVGRRDVGARGEVLVVDAGDHLRPGEVEQVGIAGDVARMLAEALAAIGLLAAHLLLQEHAPGAVEDGDPLAEDGFECLAHIRHRLLPPWKPGNADRALGLFRRLVTRSPSCLSKLSGYPQASNERAARVPRVCPTSTTAPPCAPRSRRSPATSRSPGPPARVRSSPTSRPSVSQRSATTRPRSSPSSRTTTSSRP